MDEEFRKKLEAWGEDAPPYPGKLPRLRERSSLHQIIRTKEQADQLDRDLKLARGELIIIEAPKKPIKTLVYFKNIPLEWNCSDI